MVTDISHLGKKKTTEVAKVLKRADSWVSINANWIQISLVPLIFHRIFFFSGRIFWASLVAQRLKHLPAMWETCIQSLGWEDPLEKEMATHSSILAWRIPWREEPGRLQSTGSKRVRYDWVTSQIFALQCYVNFFCTTKWISYTYTWTSWTSLPLPSSHPSRSSQSTELNSLCYTKASH